MQLQVERKCQLLSRYYNPSLQMRCIVKNIYSSKQTKHVSTVLYQLEPLIRSIILQCYSLHNRKSRGNQLMISSAFYDEFILKKIYLKKKSWKRNSNFVLGIFQYFQLPVKHWSIILLYNLKECIFVSEDGVRKKYFRY